MKKEDFIGIVAYLVMLVIAIVFGLTVLQHHATESGITQGAYFAYILGAVFSGLILNSFVYELAHLVGAKVGRYKVISFCVLGFTWYKSEGKIKFHFSNFDGLTGETKIVPDSNAKKPSNPIPYIWFGTLFFLIEFGIIIGIFGFLLSKRDTLLTDIAYFLLVMAVIGFLMLFYNIIPFKLDTTTDGYRMTIVSNPKNREAFNESLRVKYEIEQGNTDVEIKTFDVITNLTADLNLDKVYVLLDKKEFDEAEQMLDVIIQNEKNISYATYLRARAQKIYINIMRRDLAEAAEYYKTVPHDERREISNDISMASIRAYILMAGLFDKSRSECILALDSVKRAFKHTTKRRQSVEIKLFNEALDRIIEAHPDWEFEDYKLIPQETKKAK